MRKKKLSRMSEQEGNAARLCLASVAKIPGKSTWGYCRMIFMTSVA